MFEYAETAVFMGGAKLELQKYATFVTTKITENGIYNAYKKTLADIDSPDFCTGTERLTADLICFKLLRRN